MSKGMNPPLVDMTSASRLASPGREQIVQCGADAPLAALEAVVHRRVDDVAPAPDGGGHGFAVGGVGRLVRLSEIGADTDRGEPQAVHLPVMPGVADRGVGLGVALRAFRGGETCVGHFHILFR